jgi:hypothetical protein
MPPKIEPKQAIHLAQAMVSGQPDRGEIIKTILGDKVRELI